MSAIAAERNDNKNLKQIVRWSRRKIDQAKVIEGKIIKSYNLMFYLKAYWKFTKLSLHYSRVFANFATILFVGLLFTEAGRVIKDNWVKTEIVRLEPGIQVVHTQPGEVLVKTNPETSLGDPNIILTAEDDRQIMCQARNMYFEARNQGVGGMLAVGDVVINRARSGKYAPTLCGVVYQAVMVKDPTNPYRKIPARNRCQFSWYCDNVPDVVRDTAVWELAFNAARNQYIMRKIAGTLPAPLKDETGGADLYFAKSIATPTRGIWRNSKTTTQIGFHEFRKSSPEFWSKKTTRVNPNVIPAPSVDLIKTGDKEYTVTKGGRVRSISTIIQENG